MKPWGYVLGLLGLDSTKEKRVVGFELDIDIKPRDNEYLQPWRRVEAAVYIPTNERDLLRQDIAEEMGLDTKPGAAVEICWKLTDGAIPYKYRNSFLIKSDLPCRVIFGKQLKTNSIKGYPHPFEMAIKHKFDESYTFSKPRINSWGRLKEKTFSWGSLGSFERKDNSRFPSFLQRKSPVQPPTRTFATIEPISTKAADVSPRLQDVERDVEVQKATDGLKNRNDQSAIENTAKLVTALSMVEPEECSEERPDLGILKETEIYEESSDREVNVILEKESALPVSSGFRLKSSKLGRQEEFGSMTGSCESLGLRTTKSQPLFNVKEDALSAVDSVVSGNIKSDAHLAGSKHQHNGPIEVTPSAKPSESDGSGASYPQSQDINSEHEFKLQAIIEAQPSWLETESRLRSAGSNVVKEGSPHSEGEADVLHLQHCKVSELENKMDMGSEPSTIYAESSLNTALNPSTAPESPTSYGNVASCGMGRFPESVLDSTPGRDIPLEAKNASNHSSSQQEARSKIRAKKRGKAPRIRSAKLDELKAHQNVDLTPALGADEEWAYDSQAKGHYHIDSDTGSTFWYEDSESEDSKE